MAVEHSVAGYANTAREKNFSFSFKCNNLQAAIKFIARAEKKGWIIKAAWHNTREHGIKISSTRIK